MEVGDNVDMKGLKSVVACLGGDPSEVEPFLKKLLGTSNIRMGKAISRSWTMPVAVDPTFAIGLPRTHKWRGPKPMHRRRVVARKRGYGLGSGDYGIEVYEVSTSAEGAALGYSIKPVPQ